jgi:hypothetical protein
VTDQANRAGAPRLVAGHAGFVAWRLGFMPEVVFRSAWNARAAVVRYSGASVLRTPSHVKASLTAAIVVPSPSGVKRPNWVVRVLVGEGVIRRELV